MGHACELETSMVLALRPELVHMERARDDIDFVATPSYFMDWVEGGALVANPPWDDDSLHGAYGAGSLGSAEKGRRWLEAAIAEKVEHIHEIQEQQRRREERRNAGFGLWGNKE
jgi:creatinine amidohydrolase